MREIKFRAWEKSRAPEYEGEDPYKGEMHYTELGDEKRFVSIGFYHDSCWSHDDFVWMQYTGLKDSNGKEIYEGDIVSGTWGKEEGVIEVVYDEARCMWMAKNQGHLYHLYEIRSWRDLEVIGNIYESPELLTK